MLHGISLVGTTFFYNDMILGCGTRCVDVMGGPVLCEDIGFCLWFCRTNSCVWFSKAFQTGRIIGTYVTISKFVPANTTICTLEESSIIPNCALHL